MNRSIERVYVYVCLCIVSENIARVNARLENPIMLMRGDEERKEERNHFNVSLKTFHAGTGDRTKSSTSPTK